MRENKFRVWCEFEFEGEIVKEMEGPESWFLLTQTGKLMTYGPGEPLQELDKAYLVAIPLFYTGLKDKHGKEIYKGDLIRNKSGRICEVAWNTAHGQWDAYVRKTVEYDSSYGFRPGEWFRSVEVVGNKYENLELLEGKN